MHEVASMTREFEREVDLIFDAGSLPPGPPSTLVDITRRPYRVLRAGAVQLSPGDLD
jgi:tRNA A37 threonylcarbamoyladenosine synthetase subunit TsaC/SUA5/YrdC